MKTITAIMLVCLLVGCQNPVPGNRITGSFGGKPFSIETKKQTTAKGVKLTAVAGTNFMSLEIAEISGTNDPQVIDKAYAGQAAVTKAHFDGMTQLTERLAEVAKRGSTAVATGGVSEVIPK